MAGPESLDELAGRETAGIPAAAWIVERLALPMHYVGKKPRAFGRNAQIEGEMAEGARAVLVEDPAGLDSSKLNFIGAIRQARGVIAYSFIFSYAMFARSGAEGAILHWLPIRWDSLRAAQGLGYFTREQFTAIKAFLGDPDSRSTARGGSRSGAAS